MGSVANCSPTVVTTVPQKCALWADVSHVLWEWGKEGGDSEENGPSGGSRTSGSQAVKGFGPGDRKLVERFHCGNTRMERSVQMCSLSC